VVDIAVADLVAYVIRLYEPRYVPPNLLSKLASLALHFQKIREPGFPQYLGIYEYFRSLLSEQWASILGFVSSLGYERARRFLLLLQLIELTRTFVMDSVGCVPAELITSGLLIKKEADQNAYFRGLKWLSLNVCHSFT